MSNGSIIQPAARAKEVSPQYRSLKEIQNVNRFDNLARNAGETVVAQRVSAGKGRRIETKPRLGAAQLYR